MIRGGITRPGPFPFDLGVGIGKHIAPSFWRLYMFSALASRASRFAVCGCEAVGFGVNRRYCGVAILPLFSNIAATCAVLSNYKAY